MATAREILVRLRADIGDYESKMAKVSTVAENSAAKAKGKWDSFTSAIVKNEVAAQQVSGTFLKIGAAAMAVGAVAVKAFAEFDTSMSNVKAATGESGAGLQKLRDLAMEMGAATAFSAKEAADGIDNLARAGVSTADILGGGLKGSLDLAAAGQMEVADAAEISAIAMTQFGLAGKEVPHVADLLAAAAGKAMGEVSDFGAALGQSGLVAAQFGLSIEETVGGLAAFAQAGLMGSDAGTSLKAMLIALANPAGKTAKTMEELGINVYDAQGNFIGLEGLAGELRDKLGGLSQETRNQALAQIFGNDAIRAANILYENGSEGIAEWIAKVDDSGYAAEQAAIKQDNLAGDLEKLGGAWDTLMISMGDAASGPLRGVVQALDEFISSLAEAPGAAQALMGTVAGIGTLAIAAGGLIQGVIQINNFKTALLQLGVAESAVSKTAGAMGALTKAAGKLVAAIAVIDIGSKLAGMADGVVRSGEQMTSTLENIAKGAVTMDEAFKSVDGSALTTDVFGLVDGINDLDSALSALDMQWIWDGGRGDGSIFGIWATDATAAREAFDELDSALTQLDPSEASTAFAEMFDQLQAKGKDAAFAMEHFDSYFGQVRTQVQGAGPEFAYLADDMDALAEIAAGRLREGLVMTADGIMSVNQAQEQGIAYTDHLGQSYEAVATGAESAAGATDDLASSQQESAAAAKEQADAIQSAKDAILGYYDAAMGVERGNIALEESFRAMSQSIEQNGETLDATTAKGAANRSALLDIADATLNLAQQAANANRPLEEIQAIVQGGRDKFLEFGKAASKGGEDVEQLANDVGLLPEEVSILFQQDGMLDAQGATQLYNSMLKETPAEKSTTFTQPGMDAAQTATAAYMAAVTGLPLGVATQFVQPGMKQAQSDTATLTGQVKSVPNSQSTTFTQPGISNAQQQTKTLTGQIKDVPKSQATTFTQPGIGNAKSQVSSYTGQVNSVPSSKTTTIRTVADLSGYYNVNRTLNSIAGKTVSTYIAVKRYGQGAVATGGYGADVAASIGLANGGMPPSTRRYSGLLSGPGTPTSDSIPAWLSRKEFVTKAAAVDYYGPSLMYALNAMAIPKEYFKQFGFAQGGTPSSYKPQVASYVPPRPKTGAMAEGDRQTLNFYSTVHYPVAEPTSVTTKRTLDHAASLGLGG